MLILGIETSCDETAAAVVRDGKTILSNIVVSSLREHAKYGGIIPEIASRRQMECIQLIVREALEKAKTGLDDIDAIAVTTSPGLMGSLLVGISFARALSFAVKKPLIEVDHIHAHLYANFLNFEHEQKVQPKIPAVGLVVSGGHTSLYHLKNLKEFKLIGQTRDDAAGEAFDKVAKILELGYPGGPEIDRIAKTADRRSRLKFNYAEIPNSLDFSFSGVKTAVLYHHRDHNQEKGFSVNNVAAAFQESVVTVLVKKCVLACRKYKTKTLLIGGGVAANSALRERLSKVCADENIQVHYPHISLCLDNASMIAGLAFHL